MDVHESVLELVGDTPLVRLRTPGGEATAALYAKLEYLSAGGSVKDRIGLHMIEQAEREGLLRPGGTVVEATSGNTGAGLAMVAAAKGYHAVLVVPDKTSAEKIATLRGYGAEVVVRRSGLPAEDPENVFNTAVRIAGERPGSWLAAQYDNPANPAAHYATTGPEIWRQTDGRVTHLVACVGTGGTISGTGRYLKEVSGGAVRVTGADPAASVYSGGDGRPYFVEATGHVRHPETVEDVWPASYQQDVVDELIPVGDREAILTVRQLARQQGLMVGGSAGLAVAAAQRVAAGLGPDALVVVILPDSGRQYLSKYFDDAWLLRLGFLDGEEGTARVGDAVRAEPLPYVNRLSTAAEALAVLRTLRERGLPALAPAGPCPVGPDRAPTVPELAGSLRLDALAAAMEDGSLKPHDPVRDHLAVPLPHFGVGEGARSVLAELEERGEEVAVAVRDGHAVGLVDRSALRALL